MAAPKYGKVPDVGLKAAISPAALIDLGPNYQSLSSHFTT